MGLAGNGCKSVPFEGVGVEPQAQARILDHPVVHATSPDLGRPHTGRMLAAAADVPGAIGMSAGLARLLGKPKVHDQITGSAPLAMPDCASPGVAAQLAADANVQLAAQSWTGSLSAVDGEIVNLFDTPLAESQETMILAPLATLQQLFDTDAVTRVAVWLHRDEDAAAFARDLSERLRAAGLAAEVRTWDDDRVSPYYTGTMAMLGSVVGFITLLVGTVVALSVLNAMTLTILERTRELGTLRALGFTRRTLAGLFVREAVLLGTLAAASGLALGLAAAACVNHADIRLNPPGIPGTIQLLVHPGPALCATLAAVLLPVVAAVTWLAVRRRTRESVVVLLTDAAS